MFTQSNFGIVTKMGMWLMPEPAGYRPYMITFQREEDIEQVVEIVWPLRLNMVIQNAATIRSLVLDAALFKTKSQYTSDRGPYPIASRKRSWPTGNRHVEFLWGAVWAATDHRRAVDGDPRLVLEDSGREVLSTARIASATRTSCCTAPTP